VSVPVAPANHKPPIVPELPAVIAREAVGAVFERYCVGAGRWWRGVTGNSILPGIWRWRGSLVLDDRKRVADDGPGHAEQNSVDHDGVTSSPQSTQRILAYSGGVVAVFSYLCGDPFKQSALFAS
jgi:hypothetical protein